MIFNELWIMPPLYHRVYDFLTRTIVESRQCFTLSSISRYVGWYDSIDWEQPNEELVEKILTWLHNNEFIYLERQTEAGLYRISIIWSNVTFTQPLSDEEYHSTYAKLCQETYASVTNNSNITNKDIQAIYELSASNISLKRTSNIINLLSKKMKKAPSMSLVKDYTFADICYEIACGQ